MESRFFRLLLLVLILSTTLLVVPPARAQTATPTPQPAYTRPLSRANGAVPQGTDVEAVQRRLNELGFGADTPITGIYGPQTEAAVVAFQEANNLPTNGIVDGLIWDVLFPRQQDSPARPMPAQSNDPNKVRLDQFGFREESLDGPFDARYLSLRLPASWQLESGASIELDIATFFGGVGIDGTSQFLGGSLDVQFNNVVIGRIFLDKPGSQLVTMPISDTALFVPRPDGSHSLAFILDSGLNCGTDRQTSVVVRSSTLLNLPHAVKLPPASLQQLPRPLYQDSPLDPDTAALIVPAKPTMGELQAALTVAATFGNLTRNRIQIPLITEDTLTPTLRNESNLIFVGRAGTIKLVDEVELPVTAEDGSFAAAGAESDDGILQIGGSPWNENRSVLVISGDSDAAVIKASQALSAGNVRSTLNPALSVIAEVRNPETLTTTAELNQTPLISNGLVVERTLADLGYETRTAFGIGAQVFDYTFEVPRGYELTENGHFDVVFAHSSLLSYNVSGILIRVNDQPLSTIRFSDETAQNGNVRVAIPRSSLVSGENKISLSANLVPSTLCIDPNAAGVWGSIRSESLLHLALQPVRTTKQINRNLNAYFDPFTSDPTLANVAFVLPDNDSGSWSVAAQVAADLGSRIDGSMIELAAVFSDQTAAVSGTHNLIIIGKPTTQPIIAQLREAMPAPFPPNSNQPILGNSRVVYRVPEDLSLGYLEIFASPWNSERTILGILGSTDEGVQWSSAVLHTPRQRSRLNGTVAVINGEQISIENPSVTNDTSALATKIMAPTDANQTYRPLTEIPRPRWILYIIAASIGVMWLILGFVGVRAWQRSREQHRST